MEKRLIVLIGETNDYTYALTNAPETCIKEAIEYKKQKLNEGSKLWDDQLVVEYLTQKGYEIEFPEDEYYHW